MVNEKDVKRYLRRPGFSPAGTPKPPKKLAGKKAGTSKTGTKTDADEAAKLTEAAKKDAKGFKKLLADVKKATTPELEMIADKYDLRLTLSREKVVADRRAAVTKALKAKMAKG